MYYCRINNFHRNNENVFFHTEKAFKLFIIGSLLTLWGSRFSDLFLNQLLTRFFTFIQN